MSVYIVVGMAVFVVVVLSVIAAYYLFKLKKHNTYVQGVIDEQERAMVAKQQENHKSIVFLANALLQEQLSSTEASMRISWLAKSIDLSATQQEMVMVFDTLAAATKHIPILEEWKKLTRKQQFQFDKQRLALEEEYKDFILASAQKISESDFS